MKILAVLPVKECLRQSLRISEGRVVKKNGKRFSVANLKSFAMHGCKCARCGREGNKVIAWEDPGGGLHVDLFHANRDKLILMNRDHIIPKSKKGSNSEWNYQTMCVKCNCKKGNNETEGDRALAMFRNHWRNLHVRFHDAYWRWVPEALRGRRSAKWFVMFRERYLHKFTFWLARLTHKTA